MPKSKDAVSYHGIAYPIEAWQVIYDYITGHQAPDTDFERRMKRLKVSRSDAYALYRAQLHTPWEVKFVKTVLTEKKERLETIAYAETTRK